VAIYWDDIEMLRVLDECEQGVRSGIFHGFDLMEAIASQRGVAMTEGDYHSFLRELFALRSGGLLTWELTLVPPHVRQLDPHDANQYLRNIRDIALTVPTGRDRARGQIVRVPLPEPDEDDGRMIRALTLEEIADIIGAAYSPVQVMQLLVDSGVSIDDFSFENVILEGPAVVRHVLYELANGTSGRRREMRNFLGAWLGDRLHTGPSNDERERIERDLARQGWFVKDGRLVIGEPVRRTERTQASPSLPPDQLHALVWCAASEQWSAGHRNDAVLEGAKAVNSMLQAKVSRRDVSEVNLVQEAFSGNDPSPGRPRLRFPEIEDERTRESMTQGALSFGVGCFQAIRNPVGHLPNEEAIRAGGA
jgi:hypothetical protein